MASSICTRRSKSRPGQVTHRLSARHTAADFLAFMRKVVRAYPRRELHVILDNSSSHGTPEVQAWLAQHPRVHFHYTPTSASWLNQVEGFFGILGKQSLSLTDFPSKRRPSRRISAPTCAPGIATPHRSPGPSPRTPSSSPTVACLSASRRRCI